MTNPVAPPKLRGWIEAIREAALRFNDRLSRPVFRRPAGKATPSVAPHRPGVRFRSARRARRAKRTGPVAGPRRTTSESDLYSSSLASTSASASASASSSAGSVRKSSSAGSSTWRDLLPLQDDVAVVLHARARRDQAADDDVLLEAAQAVDLARDRGLGQDAGRLLERRRRDERVRRERGLRDPEEHRPGGRRPGRSAVRTRSFSSSNRNRSTCSSIRKSVSPTSSTFTLRIIWRTMTSMCLSLMATFCER